MVRVAVDFRDPQAVTKLRCDAILAGVLEVPEFLAGLRISTELPTDAPKGRLLVVRAGDWIEWGQTTAVNVIRLVGFSLDEDEAWSICSWFHGQLLAAAPDSDVVSYRNDRGPRKGIDPDFQTPICASTMLARMHPAIL